MVVVDFGLNLLIRWVFVPTSYSQMLIFYRAFSYALKHYGFNVLGRAFNRLGSAIAG